MLMLRLFVENQLLIDFIADDDDEEATPTKKKATPRKSKSATPAKEKSANPGGREDGEEAIIKEEPTELDEPNGAGEMMDDMEEKI